MLTVARWRIAGSLLLTAVGCTSPPQGTKVAHREGRRPRPPPDLRIAVTIDDLPVAGYSAPGSDEARRGIVNRLCQVISEHKLPVTGFVNMVHHEKDPELMRRWRDCGINFGNHTWSHPKLSRVGTEAFLEDLSHGHRALLDFLETPNATLPFRYPYLDRGFKLSMANAVKTRLRALASPLAPVTVDSMDWLYAKGYSQARSDSDEALAHAYVRSWAWDLQEATWVAEARSQALFQEQVPQVLLLHANAINADHLPRYLRWAKKRGYRFVSLDEALSHPAYAEDDRSLSPTGDSHWLRLARSRSMSSGPPSSTLFRELDLPTPAPLVNPEEVKGRGQGEREPLETTR